MARRVFFSFHYKDVVDFRVNVVRNCWVTHKDRKDAGFFDASIWEEAQLKGDKALKKLINDALKNTSVTCVLIGTETYSRRWIKYEIIKSLAVGNGILGVYIHNIKDKNQHTIPKGPNPFDYLAIKFNDTGDSISFLEYKNKNWVKYTDFDSYAISKVDKSLWGKAYKLSKYYNTFDWVDNDGYNNFGTWVDKVAK